mmetsp:Transcript_32345/g.53520  ORF Transcript_32345/g.53520 Transcript_32345/m.53520 type:complete len:764 (-) Transcript_32345:111-2402(-)|eukprot:CAMPEP_0119299998 /NCGR_PEP_ID=MMETSP1333-20130426/2003_1 /TAXON_ID=418940 /ORGANISM="Scyphosphaera apsteinii, Strain RCC1455" /LENGTH=763 /DNA_ID=CAMNT_0007301615 /DNA_START=44 /DNA_END=2335 /DNA_ORIENTATION=-
MAASHARAVAARELPGPDNDLDMPLASFHDYSQNLELKPDAAGRPLWICPDGRVMLESDTPVYKEATDFLVAIAEPVCRTRFMQEYQLTPYSLYAGASMGLRTADILLAMERFSKNKVPREVEQMVTTCTSRYGKVKLVMQQDRLYIECRNDPAVLEQLLQDPVLADARVMRQATEEVPEHLRRRADMGSADVLAACGDAEGLSGGSAKGARIELADESFLASTRRALEEEEDKLASRIEDFEVDVAKVREVKQRCNELDWPLMEEYDFRNDAESFEMPIELRPETQIRDYQSAALSRMFGNHRARSGIIVLPCGAGKTLVGIVAACTIRRSCLVLCNSSVSVEQWYNQFMMWAQISTDRITRFTAEHKELPHKEACIIVSTFSMLSFSGKRSAEAKQIMTDIEAREWGLLLMDEVHVVPANTFLTCTTRTKSRCKLGLTATLVREDDRINDLNFLIGPKLYEANWLDLQAKGYIAKVQCAEVWCEMTAEFYREYLKAPAALKRQLYAMNPNKFRACEYLMKYHEDRGDKVIVFSDNVFALKKYAVQLKRPMIYGPTSQKERMDWLQAFKSTTTTNTIFISKVGDTSIDLPEATVIIQIASHFGARRQEAQRLGRILRPKSRSSEDFNAFFYTLISRDTQEMYYSTKRQQFLVDQGYAFKVVPELPIDNASDSSAAQLAYSSNEEQRRLLEEVLNSNANEIQADEEEEDAAVRQAEGSAEGGAVSRKRGSMSELSGGDGLAYAEVSRGERHAIFKQRKGPKRT